MVANKADKIRRSELKKHIDKIRATLNLDGSIEILPFSALKRQESRPSGRRSKRPCNCDLSLAQYLLFWIGSRVIMNAEIIAVGTELLMGQIANTNAQYLSSRLADLGINVYYHSVVETIPDA